MLEDGFPSKTRNSSELGFPFDINVIRTVIELVWQKNLGTPVADINKSEENIWCSDKSRQIMEEQDGGQSQYDERH